MWTDLAVEAANYYHVPEVLVLATVEAETGGRNIMGDGGRAFGYGQVWLKWHFNKLLKVADDLSIRLPSYTQPKGPEDEEPFWPVVLGNDRLSMYLAAYTIKSFWSGAGGSWEQFTRSYVGPGIPQADLERRRDIWLKWIKRYEQEQDPVLLDMPGAVISRVDDHTFQVKTSDAIPGDNQKALNAVGAVLGAIFVFAFLPAVFVSRKEEESSIVANE